MAFFALKSKKRNAVLRDGLEADLQDMSIDSSSSKAHQHSESAKRGDRSERKQNIGFSRGDKTPKIHVVR